MTTPDPALLLCRIADGDEEALRQLYVEHRPRLRRYLWSQLDGDGHAVEEALQDTFLAVWRTAGAYRGEAKAPPGFSRLRTMLRSAHARPRPGIGRARPRSLPQKRRLFLRPLHQRMPCSTS